MVIDKYVNMHDQEQKKKLEIIPIIYSLLHKNVCLAKGSDQLFMYRRIGR